MRRRVGGFLLAALATVWAGAASAARDAPTAAPAPSRDRVIADFDAVPATLKVQNLKAAIEQDDGGGHSLHVSGATAGLAADGSLNAVLFRVDPALDPGNSTGLSVKLHAPKATTSIPLRWIAIDDKGHKVLQRRFDLKPGRAPQEVTIPWPLWRWGTSTGASPSEIRRLALCVEAEAPEIVVDDLRLSTAADATPADWLRKLAFGDRPVRSAEADGLMVATDAADALTDADMRRVLGRMRQGRAFIGRVFGAAVRPVDGRAMPPSSLLIFRDRQAQGDFFRRLSRAWEVNIDQPRSDGYTIQDVATSTFDPKQGADRPVFLHEAMHAVLARDVRLVVHDERQTWIHEGMVCYLQAAVYPHTLDVRELADRFALDLAAEGRAFRPLARLLNARASTPHYGQLAAVFAYLVEEKPEWLPTIAEELVKGGTADQALRACGTTMEQFEAKWVEWGKRRFPLEGGQKSAFPLPREFQPGAAEGRGGGARP